MAAMATATMADINSTDLALHTSQTQLLARLVTTVRRRITSKMIATKENVMKHQWSKCKNVTKMEMPRQWNPFTIKKLVSNSSAAPRERVAPTTKKTRTPFYH
jgi:hypothetical protein